MTESGKPIHVSLLVLPESTGTPIHGLYETLVLVNAVAATEGQGGPLFEVEIVGLERGVYRNAFSLPLEIQRSISEVERTDIVITASMLFGDNEWIPGRYPRIVEWLKRMHAGGSDVCSACAGALVLAETGLLDGLEATTHWAFAPTFRQNFPNIRLRLEELLIATGKNKEFVMSGAASSWQDLILYLIARHASPSAAQAIGKFLLYQWHRDTQAPYISFSPEDGHGDRVIREMEEWLKENFTIAGPVEAMVQRSGLPEGSFKRRFKNATGYSPLHYVQNLRVEKAKELLERSDASVDAVAWQAGYEEPASFRRIFKRITSLTPSEYRAKFHYPHGALARK